MKMIFEKLGLEKEWSLAIGWLSAAFTCMVGVIILRSAFTMEEDVVLAGMGILSLVLSFVYIQKRFPRTRPIDSIKVFFSHLNRSSLGFKNAALSIGLIVLMTGIAIELGSGKEESMLAVVEGLRSGVLFWVGISVWRLKATWRMAVVLTWIVSDIFIFSRVGIHGLGSGWVTLLFAAMSGWLLFMSCERIEKML